MYISRELQLIHTSIFKQEMMDVKQFIDKHLPPVD